MNVITPISNPELDLIPTPIESNEILIVDDHLENLRVLSHILTTKGFSVRKATGREMALRSVASLPPDLILLDILMPDLNGYEVCVQLKRNPKTSEIPIIFLSALNDSLDIDKAFEVGGADYLTKPFQVMEVLARINNQLTLKAAQEKVLQLNAKLQEWVLVRNSSLHICKGNRFKTDNQDNLIDLPNRIALLAKLKQSLFLAKMDDSYLFALLYLNCDQFKRVNHEYSHQVGDELLKQIALRLHEVFQPKDIIAWLGGDEFAILHPLCSDTNEAIQLAGNVLASLAKPFWIHKHEITITVSIGIDFGHADCEDSETILNHAETAMYKAKASSRGKYMLYSPNMEYGC